MTVRVEKADEIDIMNGMLALVSAVALFVVSHVLLSLPRLREALVARVGESTFRGLYSAIALALLLWVALTYRDAPIIDIWYPPIGLMHLSLLITPVASILLMAGLTTPSPSAIHGGQPEIINGGPVGILKITRHPVTWAVVLWGFAHLLANGDAASIILFGGIYQSISSFGSKPTRLDRFLTSTKNTGLSVTQSGRRGQASQDIRRGWI